MLGSPSMKNQSNFKTRPSSSLFQNSKRLRGYIQMGVIFSSKKHTPLEDPKKRYTVSLRKALRQCLFLLSKT